MKFVRSLIGFDNIQKIYFIAEIFLNLYPHQCMRVSASFSPMEFIHKLSKLVNRVYREYTTSVFVIIV